MTMLKTFPAVNLTVTGALAGVELGATPFQLGGNCCLRGGSVSRTNFESPARISP